MQTWRKFFSSKSVLPVTIVLLGGSLLLPGFSGRDEKTRTTSNYSTPRKKQVHRSFSATKKIAPNATLFEQNLPVAFSLPDPSNLVANRILKDYGAVLVAQGNVAHPPKVIFADEADCFSWQSHVITRRENLGGVLIELQAEAMHALLAAQKEAAGKKLQITARGTWAARRSYRDTEKIWLRRVKPGLIYWTRRKKLNANEATRIRRLAPARQVKEILQLEAKGLYFSKNYSKSVLYSGTAPGASQHISMLALDINENNSAAVRAILARHGWFQTIISDLPHFTYLGTTQNKLPALGLKKILKHKRIYWIPAWKKASYYK